MKSSAAPSRTHEGRIAVVTGAAQGIGQAIARGLAARGAAVVGVDLADLAQTEGLVTALGSAFLGIRADVAAEDGVARVAAAVEAHFGYCDVLVNNAGIYNGPTWDQLDYATWRRFQSVNLDSQFLVCKALVPGMRARGWGRIVNLTSDSVLLSGGNVAYKASKMGVIGFTRGLANELGPYGITVNATSPSFTRTPGTLAMLAAAGDPDRIFAEVAQRQAIKKVSEPDDVVGTILFLTSEDSSFVTGQTILADGGLAYL